jgi:replicative DNA helicase
MSELKPLGPATLPFNQQRQDAVLGHLMISERFFKQCRETIKPTWFADMYASKVWAAKLAFYKQYDRIPTFEELQFQNEWKLENQSIQNRMKVKALEAMNLTTLIGLDTLLDELTTWLHARYFHEGVGASTDMYNAGQTEQAFTHLEEKLKLIRTTNFDNSIEFDFNPYIAFRQRRQIEVANSMTFGNPDFDRLLLPKANGAGSLLPGDSTILLAPTNIGKTTTMITLALANMYREKNVLFVAHEGVDDDLAEKMWCSAMNVNKAQLDEMIKTTEGNQMYLNALKWINAHFTFVPMMRPGLCVEEVAAVIRRKQEERMAKTGGRGYDMVVNDYPQLLSSNQMAYGQFQKRDLDAYVYKYFVQLALEYKFHFVGAIQTNRTGAKINKGQKGQEFRLLVPEDVNESYGPMMTATNVITINRDAWCESLGYVVYYIGKSRSSEKGWAIICKSNYANAITHSEGMGATWYRGNLPPGDQVEMLFKQYRGREIERVMFSSRD